MDAKLIEARARIESILIELDIAGYVVLHNAPGSLEVFVRLDPSYSKLVLNARTGEARLRSVLADYGGDREAKQRDLAATLNMVSGMGELIGRSALDLIELGARYDALTGAKHTALERDEGTAQ